MKKAVTASIEGHFGNISDPRIERTKLHKLIDILVIAICGAICNCDSWEDVEEFGKAKREWFETFLELPNGIPSHDTFNRVFARIDPIEFRTCFMSWVSVASELIGGQVIAMDGKVLRRSHDRAIGKGAIDMVSAWACANHLVLGQIKVDEKSNEITAIPELLANIEIKDAVITIDAAGCQRKIAKTIVDGKGDYVLSLKGNQGTMHDSVATYVKKQMENDFADVKAERFTETLKGHGRRDEITYYQMPVPKDLANREKWAGLKTIGVAVRYSESGDTWSTEVRYYLNSIAMGVKRFARFVRGHWAIESTLHWCLDMTFREDESRVRDRTTANNLAWLKRFGLSLLKQQDDKYSIAMRRRVAGWNLDYLAQVLGIPKA